MAKSEGGRAPCAAPQLEATLRFVLGEARDKLHPPIHHTLVTVGLRKIRDAAESALQGQRLVIDHGEQCYLPLNCPLCGRRRLEYTPATGELACEKCGADAETLNHHMAGG